MNLEEIAQAMIDLAIDPEGREQMGEAGYKRVTSFYRIEQMKETYKEIYRRFAEKTGWRQDNGWNRC